MGERGQINVAPSKRENSGSQELKRDITREQGRECVARLMNRGAAGANEVVNEVMKRGGE